MKNKIRLSAVENKELKKAEKSAKSYKIWRKVLAIRMKSKGYRNEDIAKCIGVHQETISRWIRTYNQNRFKSPQNAIYDLLTTNYKQEIPKTKLTPEHWDKIRDACELNNREIISFNHLKWLISVYTDVKLENDHELENIFKKQFGDEFDVATDKDKIITFDWSFLNLPNS